MRGEKNMRTMVGTLASGLVMAAGPLLGQPMAQNVAVIQSRYQITQMERVFGGAAEHGARVARERMRDMIPADLLLSENVRVRGIHLEGYGLFFDVEMPPLEGTLPWVLQTLDQNNLGLESAVRELRAFVESAGATRDVRQALERIQLEVATGPTVSPISRQDVAGVGAGTPDRKRSRAQPRRGSSSSSFQFDPGQPSGNLSRRGSRGAD